MVKSSAYCSAGAGALHETVARIEASILCYTRCAAYQIQCMISEADVAGAHAAFERCRPIFLQADATALKDVIALATSTRELRNHFKRTDGAAEAFGVSTACVEAYAELVF